MNGIIPGLFFAVITFVLIYVLTINAHEPYEELINDIYTAQTFTVRDIEYARNMMINAHFKLTAIITFSMVCLFLGVDFMFGGNNSNYDNNKQIEHTDELNLFEF